MNNVQKLAEMGCGNGILNSVIDRGNIQAAIANANTFLKYCKYALKSGIYTKENAIDCLLPYYNELKRVEHLVEIYHELYREQFCKVKLNIEKIMQP